jgi:hypothetical protein
MIRLHVIEKTEISRRRRAGARRKLLPARFIVGAALDENRPLISEMLIKPTKAKQSATGRGLQGRWTDEFENQKPATKAGPESRTSTTATTLK